VASSTQNVICVEELIKTYKSQTAVNAVSFNIRRGEIFGFLGPNGAGKTTTIKAILGLIRFDSGHISINGKNSVSEGKIARQWIGYLPERVSLYRNLTAQQNLSFFADLKKVESLNYNQILSEYGLEDTGKKKLRDFSKGMVQRLGMAQSLIGEPDILILDEPSGGLDPRGVRLIRNKIREAKSRGTTVFLSSHILSEVQAVCDRVGIIHKGRLVAEDSVNALGKKLNLKPMITVQVEKMTDEISTAVQNVKNIETVNIVENTIEVVCDAATKAKVILSIAKAGANIINLQTEEPSLEEVFMRYTEG
jgi:ABC-2 type transport system ATP-binding protein